MKKKRPSTEPEGGSLDVDRVNKEIKQQRRPVKQTMLPHSMYAIYIVVQNKFLNLKVPLMFVVPTDVSCEKHSGGEENFRLCRWQSGQALVWYGEEKFTATVFFGWCLAGTDAKESVCKSTSNRYFRSRHG